MLILGKICCKIYNRFKIGKTKYKSKKTKINIEENICENCFA